MAPSPPAYCGAFARLVSPGGGAFAKFALPEGLAFTNPRAIPEAFDLPAVSYQNITTQKVLLKKMQIGSSVKDRNKLKRVVKACSQFYACISPLLIKQEFIHSENRSYRCDQHFLVIESNFR